MWAYASKLPEKEYKEWIEDGSTMTEVEIGLGPPQFDKLIKSPVPWVGCFSFKNGKTSTKFFLMYKDCSIGMGVVHSTNM